MATVDDIFDALMRDCRKPADLIGRTGLLAQMAKKSVEQSLPVPLSDNPVRHPVFGAAD